MARECRLSVVVGIAGNAENFDIPWNDAPECRVMRLSYRYPI